MEAGELSAKAAALFVAEGLRCGRRPNHVEPQGKLFRFDAQSLETGGIAESFVHNLLRNFKKI